MKVSKLVKELLELNQDMEVFDSSGCEIIEVCIEPGSELGDPDYIVLESS